MAKSVLACVANSLNRLYSPSKQRLPKACSDIPQFVHRFFDWLVFYMLSDCKILAKAITQLLRNVKNRFPAQVH